MTLGFAVYKKGFGVLKSTTAAVLGMYICIVIGTLVPVKISTEFGIPPTGVWVIILLIYAWIASTLPVTMLLQPRDYINAWQLFIAMALMTAGAATASVMGNLPMVAPVINTNLPEDSLPIWPFMFVIIACGAISGFHSLVASGTSPKQVSKEPDALFVGYGSMLLEGSLAILVLVCVGAGVGMALELSDGTILTGTQAWQHQYSSWMGAKGLTDKIAPVVTGAANMMKTIGVQKEIGITLIGVFIASFAGTTLDTSVRLQRYVVSELALDLKLNKLSNRWVATTIAVITAAGLAFATGANGTGAMTLWPLFGTANQLLAALALLVVTTYLKTKGGYKFLVTAIPCFIMLIITGWAMLENEIKFIQNTKWLLVFIGGIIFIFAFWMTIETILVLFNPAQKNPLKQSA
jgi:carbon starvation protein